MLRLRLWLEQEQAGYSRARPGQIRLSRTLLAQQQLFCILCILSNWIRKNKLRLLGGKLSSYFSPWRRCGILGLLKWRPICQFFHLVKWTIFASQHKWKLGKFKQSFQVKNSPEDNCNIIVTKERQKEGSFNGQWKQGTEPGFIFRN